MKTYSNLSRNSGVESYEIAGDSIIVKFVDSDDRYEYNSVRPGILHVDKMKELAVSGQGLSTYVATHVRKNFFRKF